MAQLVSAPPCHGGGRGFKSRQGRHLINFKSGQIAQSVERPPEKWKVSGSIPLLATINPQSGNGLGILCFTRSLWVKRQNVCLARRVARGLDLAFLDAD